MTRTLTLVAFGCLLSAFVSAAKVRVFNVGGDVKAPVAVKRPPIDYSVCRLEGKRLSGIPIAEAIIGVDGTVSSAEVVKRVDPCIDRTFLKNLRAWKFKPGTLKREPVAVRMNFTLHIHYR
jgi:hypothetical protein